MLKPGVPHSKMEIRNAVLMDEEMMTNPEELGKVVETSVYKHVAAFYYQQASVSSQSH